MYETALYSVIDFNTIDEYVSTRFTNDSRHEVVSRDKGQKIGITKTFFPELFNKCWSSTNKKSLRPHRLLGAIA